VLETRFREATLRAFAGVPGAWDDERGLGTAFFWAHRQRRRKRLTVNTIARRLDIEEGGSVAIDGAALADQLAAGNLFPGQILAFSALAFFAGVKPILGWSLEFATRMRSILLRLLEEFAPDEVSAVASVPLDNMNLASLAKARTPTGLEDLGAFDVIARGGMDEDYLRALDAVPRRAFFSPLLSATYGYAVSKYGHAEPRAASDCDQIQAADLGSELDRLDLPAAFTDS
jgi:hypothetical protein